jgi:sugar phosphate isomerase/epimerase
MNYEKLMGYVHNVYLRDSTPEQLQVRVGQGIIEYGKLINLLKKAKYDRALCVDIQPVPDSDIDHDGELRKLRLLLESLVMI